MGSVLSWEGISQPFRIENGSVAKSKSDLLSRDTESPHISESIRSIVRTTVGEWLTNSYIGTNFRSIVFKLFSFDFDTYIEYKLTEAIEAQDPRVVIVEMEIIRDEDTNTIVVRVSWDINPEIVENFSNPNGEKGYVTDVEIPDMETYLSNSSEGGDE